MAVRRAEVRFPYEREAAFLVRAPRNAIEVIINSAFSPDIAK
jgi:hypothetical protein